MHWLIILAIVGFLLYALTRKAKGDGSATKSLGSGNSAGKGTNFLPPIPKGFQIFASRLSVAGIQYRRDDALRFANDSDQTVALERDSDNPHDPNALKVIGVGREMRRVIGYVPREAAEQIVGSGLADVVQARLERIWCGGDGYVDITFQIIGPKDKKAQFYDFLKGKPADPLQKEFLKFFGLPIPRGLSAGQAEPIIAEQRKRLEAEDKAMLDEWDAYVDICDEFDDADFRDTYDLKKVSRTLLKEALEDLKGSGATMRSLADDIEKVVEKLIALKPDIEKK